MLETTRRSAEELARLADVDARKAFGVGVIDVKDLQVETSEVVAGRLEALAKIVGAGRIAYANPDCGLQHLPRDAATGKLRALVKGRDLYMGK